MRNEGLQKEPFFRKTLQTLRTPSQINRSEKVINLFEKPADNSFNRRHIFPSGALFCRPKNSSLFLQLVTNPERRRPHTKRPSEQSVRRDTHTLGKKISSLETLLFWVFSDRIFGRFILNLDFHFRFLKFGDRLFSSGNSGRKPT